MALTLNVSTAAGKSVVALSGSLDVAAAPKLKEQLVKLINDGNYQLVVDLQSVDFVDGDGLAVLTDALKSVRAKQGSLRLVCNQLPILKSLQYTGLTKVFPIHTTLQDAVNATD